MTVVEYIESKISQLSTNLLSINGDLIYNNFDETITSIQDLKISDLFDNFSGVTTSIFIYGEPSFQNLVDSIPTGITVFYLNHPITSNDNPINNGYYMEEVYSVSMFFGQASNFDFVMKDNHQAIIAYMRQLKRKFLSMVSSDETVITFKNVKTTDVINLFNLNLSGVYLNFDFSYSQPINSCF